MLSLKISSIVIFIGSLLFLIAAFLPISRVYAFNNSEDKLALIKDAEGAWNISQTLFSLGAIVTVLGVALAAFILNGRSSAPMLYLAATLLFVGAAAWTWQTYLRAKDPIAFAEGSLTGWHFALYTLLTLAAILLIGISILQLGFSTWAGWLLIGGALFLFVLYIIFKDMPPFVHYLLFLALAFVVFRAG